MPTIGVLCFVEYEDKILLIQRGKIYGYKTWHPPGGRIEPGESPEAAAYRETREETRVEVEKSSIRPILEEPVYDDEFDALIYLFRADVARYTEPKAGSDAMDAKYIPKNELNKYPMTKNMRKFLEIYLKE